MRTRDPAVQGRFYPGTKDRIEELISQIEMQERYPAPDLLIHSVIGAVLPHAGHIYSGYQTIPFFQLLIKEKIRPDTFVIVHPSHSGFGEPVCLDDSNSWKNALGSIELDMDFGSLLELPESGTAHAHEHSGEVILPFIQYYFKGHPFRIVPICMSDQSFESASELGNRIFRASQRLEKQIMVLASSDFSHFLSSEDGYKADQPVVDAITSGDIEGVYKAVKQRRISVCGYGPIMTLMAYSALVDPDYNTYTLARGHSGEVSPSSEVVDYISFLMYN